MKTGGHFFGKCELESLPLGDFCCSRVHLKCPAKVLFGGSALSATASFYRANYLRQSSLGACVELSPPAPLCPEGKPQLR